MKQKMRCSAVGRMRMVALLLVLMFGFTACSGFDFFGGNKVKAEKNTEKEAKEDGEEIDAAEEDTEEEETKEKSKSKKKKTKKKEEAEDSEESSGKDQKKSTSKVKVWGEKSEETDDSDESKKPEKNKKDKKDKSDKKSNQGSGQLLTDAEAREIILKEYLKYDQTLSKAGYELDLPAPKGENAGKYLYLVDNEDFLKGITSFGFQYGVNIVREVYPGPYLMYLMFPDQESVDTFKTRDEWVAVVCFYVNRKTGTVFFAAGPNGIHRLPDGYIVYYVPDRFEGYSDFHYILSGLEEVGYIKSKHDYTWKLDMENWDYENPPYKEGNVPEGRVRLMIFHKKTEKYFGTFDIEQSTHRIYNAETRDLIYRHPGTDIPKKKITAENAAQETEKIVRRLELIDAGDKKLTFLAGEEFYAEEIGEKVFSIGVMVDDDDFASYVLFINRDGTKVANLNNVTQEYEIIYGNHLP